MQAQSSALLRGEAARLLGVCTQTLANWERTGRLVPTMYTARGVRIYDRAQVEALAAERNAAARG